MSTRAEGNGDDHHERDTPSWPLMSDFLIEQADAVLRVTINHPERGNGMTDDMATQLTGIIDGAAARASVLVLAGAGQDFCIGRHRTPGAPPPGPADAIGRRDASDTIF